MKRQFVRQLIAHGRIVGLLFLAALVGSCSSINKKEGASTFQLRPYQEETLPNGLKVLFIADNSLPRVTYGLMIKAGTANEPADLPGLHAMVTSLLDQGTKNKSAPEVADAFAQLGMDFATMPLSDYSIMSVSGLSIYSREALKLFSESALMPTFDRKELERMRARRIAEIVKAQDQPSAFAEELFDKEIFGHHPYSHSAAGTVEGVKKIKRDDLVHYYHKYFRPGNSILSVVGNIDESLKTDVRKTFSVWTSGPEITRDRVDQPDLPHKSLKLVSKPGLKQTQIRIGHLGIRRTDPDFMALRMANSILGGSFSSRLNQRVRDDLGLTYSIGSSSDTRLDRGAIQISTFTRNEKAAETIRETLAVLDDFVQRGVTEGELNASKALMIGQFPAGIETVDRLATNLMVLRRYGVSDDYLKKFNLAVGQLTVKDVNEAIRRNIQPDRLKIIVYADKAQVMPALKTLGSWTIEDLK